MPYLARSEKDMGAVPGETPRTFCEPAYRQSISENKLNKLIKLHLNFSSYKKKNLNQMTHENHKKTKN